MTRNANPHTAIRREIAEMNRRSFEDFQLPLVIDSCYGEDALNRHVGCGNTITRNCYICGLPMCFVHTYTVGKIDYCWGCLPPQQQYH